jgi:hexosaminidase
MKEANLLAAHLRASTGFALPVRDGSSSGGNAIFLTTTNADRALGAEGYALSVKPGGVVIRAPRAAGVFYGTQTLRQLFPPRIESRSSVHGVAWQAKGVLVRDMPRFQLRGFMLDSSRHIQTIGFIKRTLDLMAYHKLNRFHWHLVDDAGWRLEIKKYPLLTQVGAWRTERDGTRYGGFFTQDQVRDIVKYAADRHISVQPEIEMPGHSYAALAAYPWLACFPSDDFKVKLIGQGGPDVYCPSKPSTYRFNEDVLREVMALFPNVPIHIGGDEVPKQRWKEHDADQRTILTEHLGDEKGLQHFFIRRIAEFLKANGRRMQGWNEIMEGGPLPKGVVMHQWNSVESGAEAARAGNDVVVSLTKWYYLDYDYNTTPLSKVYASEPMPAGLTPEQQKHILGPQANLWTERRVDDAACDDFIWPRLIALAEVGWSPVSTRDWRGFATRMKDHHYDRLAVLGLGTPGPVPTDLKQQLIAHSDFPE